MTESMIERVKAAIKAELPEYTGVSPDYLETLYRNAAEAAIEVMREPTERMHEAGTARDDGGDQTNSIGVYKAMIDAALIWPPGSADIAGVPLAED